MRIIIGIDDQGRVSSLVEESASEDGGSGADGTRWADDGGSAGVPVARLPVEADPQTPPASVQVLDAGPPPAWLMAEVARRSS
jgi:hypothetical protein